MIELKDKKVIVLGERDGVAGPDPMITTSCTASSIFFTPTRKSYKSAKTCR